MKRAELDDFARQYRLDESATALALDLAGARPGRAAWRAFALRLARAAGIASLAAGAIFFVAANWQRFDALGRLGLAQAALVAAVAAAWWRPAPHAIGRGAAVLAFLLTGALLALFGITYQTGADTYELFVAWALLGLPFALAGASAAAWAAWCVVVNVAMALFCGWMGPGDFVWGLFDRWHLGKAFVLMLPFVANLAGVALFSTLREPRWLVRLVLTLAFAYGTVATLSVAAGGGWWREMQSSNQDAIVFVAFAAACIAIAYATLQAKRDVFPMALIIAAWIAISTAAIIHGLKLNDLGGFFLISMWIILTSTVAGFVLMKWVREWRIDEGSPGATA